MNVYIMYKDNNFTLYPGRKYVVGGTDTCDIYLEELPEKVDVKVKKDVVIIDGKEYFFGSYNVKVNQVVFKLVILKPEKYYLVNKNNIFIGQKDDADICIENSNLDMLISYDEGTKIITNGSFYLNGERQKDSAPLKEYDVLVFEEGLSIVILNKSLALASNFNVSTNLIVFEQDEQEDRAKEFHRSPRIILREPTDRIIIGTPPTEEDPTRQSLLRLLLMPASMILFTVLIYIYSSSGAMMIMMFGMSVVTIITSLHGYVSDKKNYKERQIKKVQDYKEYLQGKYIELAKYAEEQKQSLTYHYPDVSNILSMAKNVDR